MEGAAAEFEGSDEEWDEDEATQYMIEQSLLERAKQAK